MTSTKVMHTIFKQNIHLNAMNSVIDRDLVTLSILELTPVAIVPIYL